ncbi:unnamed protein product [Vicia faba]|uniref:Uncharacterized protein n=1 Tax=Vicia faba TaxID=3906 RepID=A0AAV0Z7I6_VICFA|nr:unnamed protein product [Vicia faba]
MITTTSIQKVFKQMFMKQDARKERKKKHTCQNSSDVTSIAIHGRKKIRFASWLVVVQRSVMDISFLGFIEDVWVGLALKTGQQQSYFRELLLNGWTATWF